MKRLISILCFVAIPLTVLALDYTDSAKNYKDAGSFTSAERVAVSVLTNLGAVQGYPDGTFQPKKNLNRAEFLKIVLMSNPDIRVIEGDSADCFPDVKKADWFSKYVCLSQTREIIEGYPDGTFKPAQNVNYAEGLKILGEMYSVMNTDIPGGSAWYARYRQGAIDKGVSLPEWDNRMDHLLTRGEMARLAAQYRAYKDGELDRYTSEYSAQNSSRSSSSSMKSGTGVSVTSSSSSVSSIASSSSSSTSNLFPATDSFLLMGSRSDALADGIFKARDASPGKVIGVKVKTWTKVRSMQKLHLVDHNGTVLATLNLDPYDNSGDDRKWVGVVEAGKLTLNASGTNLGLVADVYARESSQAVPDELVRIQEFSLDVQPETGDSYTAFGTNAHYPSHQVVQARITKVQSILSSADLNEGNNQLVGEFRFEAQTTTSVIASLEHLTFNIAATNVTLEDWILASVGNTTQTSCTTLSATQITCLNIASQIGSISAEGTVLELRADVNITSPGASFKADLVAPGAVGTNGAVRWSDGVGHYGWVDFAEPVANGKQLTDN